MYRRLWLAGATASAVVGIAFAAVTLPTVVLVAVPLFGALLGTSARLIAGGHDETIVLWQSGRTARTYLPWAVLAAAVVSAAAGWAANGTLGVSVIALLVVSAPPTLRWARQVRKSGRAEVPSHPMDDLSDSDVVFAWRCSYIALLRARSAAEITSIIETRSRCLDEFERRDPAAFTRWIDAGSHAASDPLHATRSTRER